MSKHLKKTEKRSEASSPKHPVHPVVGGGPSEQNAPPELITPIDEAEAGKEAQAVETEQSLRIDSDILHSTRHSHKKVVGGGS